MSEQPPPPPDEREPGPATERDSVELLETLLDLTTNMLTGLERVGGREIGPVAAIRPLLMSLRHFPSPQQGGMSGRLRAAVVEKRRETIAGIARHATAIARRFARDRSSPAAATLHGLWQQVGTLAGASSELDLQPLESGLRAATNGPLHRHVGYRDRLRFWEDIESLRAGGEAERRAVLKRWTAQIARTWHPKGKGWKRLREDGDPARLKRDALYAGLFEALVHSDRLQRVKVGKEWVKDQARPISHPRPMRVAPERYLTRWMGPEWFWIWLRRQAIARAEQYILGVPDDRFVDAAKEFERDLRRATRRPHEDVGVALAGFLEDADLRTREQSVEEEADDGLEQDPRRNRLEMLLAAATSDERALLDAWKRHTKGSEAPSSELAQELNKKPATVRKTKERLLRRARQL